MLKQFFENAKQTSTSRGTVAAREISEGLQHVFNSALGTALLYGFERFQYVELLQAHPDIPLTKLFGAEHLLRLFVMLPNQLMYVMSHSDELTHFGFGSFESTADVRRPPFEEGSVHLVRVFLVR